MAESIEDRLSEVERECRANRGVLRTLETLMERSFTPRLDAVERCSAVSRGGAPLFAAEVIADDVSPIIARRRWPVVSGLPVRVRLPGDGGMCEVLFLRLDDLTEGERVKAIRYLMSSFGLSETEAAAELSHGFVPIRYENCRLFLGSRLQAVPVSAAV